MTNNKIHSFDKVYVKFIDYVDLHPGCTWPEIQHAVHPGKPLYTSRTEFASLVPAYITSSRDKGRLLKYVCTDDGHELVESARKYKWVFEIIDLVKQTKSRTLEEFDLNLTLMGKHDILEAKFLENVLDLREDFYYHEYIPTLFRKKIMFFDRIEELACNLNPQRFRNGRQIPRVEDSSEQTAISV